MIPGTTVAIGGEDFIVPPLSIARLREFLPRLQELSGLDTTQMGVAQLEALVAIITAALQRNYPDMTTTKVEEILDLGNALPVLNAILGGIKLPALEPKPIGPQFGIGELRGLQGNEPAAPDGQPGASEPTPPFEPHYPWRPNPPVVGS
jgi:hypothetical protein